MERENGSCSELRPSIFFRVQSLKCVITRGVLQRRWALSESWFEAVLSAFASQDRQKPMGLWLAASSFFPHLVVLITSYLRGWYPNFLSSRPSTLEKRVVCLVFWFRWIGRRGGGGGGGSGRREREGEGEGEGGGRLKMWTRKMDSSFSFFWHFTFVFQKKTTKENLVNICRLLYH